MNLIILLTLLILCLCGLLALHLYLPSFILSSSSLSCENYDTEEERAECVVNGASNQRQNFPQVDKERRAFIVHFQMNAPGLVCTSSSRSSSLDLFFKGIENTIALLNEEFSPPLTPPKIRSQLSTLTPPTTITQRSSIDSKKMNKNGTRTLLPPSSSSNRNSSKIPAWSNQKNSRTSLPPPSPSSNQIEEEKLFKKHQNISYLPPIVSVTNLPFVVAIVYFEAKGSESGSEIKLLCGGSLLDATHVLTSARCLPKIANFMASGHCVQAWIGMSGWDDRDFYGAKINVALAYQHIGYKFEEWGSRTGALFGGGSTSTSTRGRGHHNESRELRGNYWNDIAILQLEMPVENYNYFSICVGGPWRRYDRVKGFVAGFESFSQNYFQNDEKNLSVNDSQLTRRLVGAEETIFETENCNHQLDLGHGGSASSKPVTSDRQVCTSQTGGYGEPDRGAMIGGPLFMKIDKNEYIQVGIISYNLTTIRNVQNEDLNNNFDEDSSKNSTKFSTGGHHHHHWVYTKTATFQNFIQQFAPGVRFC